MLKKIIYIYALIITIIFAIYIIISSIESGRNTEAMRELENINTGLRIIKDRFAEENRGLRNIIERREKFERRLEEKIRELSEIGIRFDDLNRKALEGIGKIEQAANQIRD